MRYVIEVHTGDTRDDLAGALVLIATRVSEDDYVMDEWRGGNGMLHNAGHKTIHTDDVTYKIREQGLGWAK
jgi:hypothetical protein